MDYKRARRLTVGVLVGTVGFAVAGLLIGCHDGHRHHVAASASASDSGYETLGCQMCYDEIIKVKRTLPASKRIGAAYRVYREHQCPDCNADMKVYSDGGTLMVKCGRCAPEGKPCDKCIPPNTI